MSKKPKLGTRDHEVQTRKNMLAQAKLYGFYEDLKAKFDYWDLKLRNCSNEIELEDMKKVAMLDIFTLYDQDDGLSIDGQDVIPARKKEINE